MPRKYKITLTSEERRSLEQMVRSAKTPARTLTRARVLLKAGCAEGREGWTDEQVVEALDVGRATVERIRQRSVEEGFETALYSRRPGRRYQHKLDGEAEAPLVAPACTEPPAGRARRTVRLLTGREARSDFEYVRRGVTNPFHALRAFGREAAGRGPAQARAREWAEVRRELVDAHHPEAERAVVVLDNLNTHAPSSLYEVFKPEEARRIARCTTRRSTAVG